MTVARARHRNRSSGAPAVVVGHAAPDIERYAAAELCRYLALDASAETQALLRLFRLTQAVCF